MIDGIVPETPDEFAVQEFGRVPSLLPLENLEDLSEVCDSVFKRLSPLVDQYGACVVNSGVAPIDPKSLVDQVSQHPLVTAFLEGLSAQLGDAANVFFQSLVRDARVSQPWHIDEHARDGPPGHLRIWVYLTSTGPQDRVTEFARDGLAAVRERFPDPGSISRNELEQIARSRGSVRAEMEAGDALLWSLRTIHRMDTNSQHSNRRRLLAFHFTLTPRSA